MIQRIEKNPDKFKEHWMEHNNENYRLWHTLPKTEHHNLRDCIKEFERLIESATQELRKEQELEKEQLNKTTPI